MHRLENVQCIKQPNKSYRFKQLYSINELSKEINIMVIFVRSDELHNERRRNSG
jgi:hypothetical protein